MDILKKRYKVESNKSTKLELPGDRPGDTEIAATVPTENIKSFIQLIEKQ